MMKVGTKTLGRLFFLIGAMGLLLVFLLNFFAVLALGKPNAMFFSSVWWSQWFPAYIAWPAFLILGAVFRTKARFGGDSTAHGK